ncbi:MAG: acyl-CoA dehydrogenase [Solirubrobacteraceae bacterium]|nr:acyl-CoA dehydrogenase [Solirubrobacteraceae bacterium]
MTVDADTLLDRADLRFLLHDWLDVGGLADRPAFDGQSGELYDEVLGLAERIAVERFAPHNRDADEHEPHRDEDGRVVLVDGVQDALRAFADAGLGGLSLPSDVGGMDLPVTVAQAAFAWFQAANVGTAAYPMLTTAAAGLLLASGSPEQIHRFVPPMVEGRFTGTMCLSETQAGSSLADVATRAEPLDDGRFRLFGSKMWISGGEHELAENIVHLVLARLPDAPAGSKGISLFVVPRLLVADDGTVGERNDVTLVGLNHKMGYRGTVNTVLAFGEGTHRPEGAAGAIGELVGESGRGLATMFRMMNEARIGVGLGATALGYTGFRKALRYARERPQGRPAGVKDPSTPPVPIVEHADVRRMLLTQKAYVEGALALLLYCARLVDDAHSAPDDAHRERAGVLLEMLTPIAKSWPSQWCLDANALAIQVHGGYGYARDYEVEQHYRDNRLNAIHEGTHGIQAQDLLGRKVTMRGGTGLAALAETIGATVERATAAGGVPAELAGPVRDALSRLLEVTGTLWADGPAGADVALANASTYLEAAGDVVIAWIWLEQLLALADRDDAFAAGKRHAARWFVAAILPRTGPQFDLLARKDRTVLDMDEGWLG